MWYNSAMAPKTSAHEETRSRSLLKAVTYRVLIIILDFVFLYLLTARVDIAIGFTLFSNLYAMIAYYLHVRAWNRVEWGKVHGA